MLAPELSEGWRKFFVRWPRFWLWRALTLGFVTVLVFVPMPLLVIYLLDPPPLDRLDIIVLKALWAAFVGALITPIICAAATYPPHQKRGGSDDLPVRESLPSDSESLPTANP